MSSDCRLYLISPPAIVLPVFAQALEEAVAAGDVAAFQLRLKNITEDALAVAVKTLMPLCHRHDIAFILNDNAVLAAKWGCDGAHLGKDDGNITAARKILGTERTLGASCYNSRHLAMEAAENGADYVAFGSFYPSPTKTMADVAEIETLQAWTDASVIPACAIGGITPQNCLPLVVAGANFLAVSSAVWGYTGGVARAIQDFNAAIQKASL